MLQACFLEQYILHRYNRKSSKVIEINGTLHLFLNNTYDRKSNTVMKMNIITIHQKSKQYV